jgi:hypothetical protein
MRHLNSEQTDSHTGTLSEGVANHSGLKTSKLKTSECEDRVRHEGLKKVQAQKKKYQRRKVPHLSFD